MLQLVDSLTDRNISAESETSTIPKGTSNTLEHVEPSNGSDPVAPFICFFLLVQAFYIHQFPTYTN